MKKYHKKALARFQRNQNAQKKEEKKSNRFNFNIHYVKSLFSVSLKHKFKKLDALLFMPRKYFLIRYFLYF
jgi:hypothetical protein